MVGDIVIKNQEELKRMRAAGRLNAEVLSAVCKKARPGITTEELDSIAEEMIRKNGAIPIFKGYPGPYPFPSTLTISINEELVHGIPGKRKLKVGDIVSIDCGTLLDGFVGDSAITIGIGEISPEATKLLKTTKQSLYKGIEQMRPGNRAGDVSAEIQRYVENRGYHVTREYTGHGVGRQMHEGPQVPNYGTKGKGVLLRPGMTVALEPMVLVGTPKTSVSTDKWTVVSADGSLTAHFEHTVAITINGPEILTRL